MPNNLIVSLAQIDLGKDESKHNEIIAQQRTLENAG